MDYLTNTLKMDIKYEKADNWLTYGDPWSIRREKDKVIVNFNDGSVRAVPYDTPIIGYDSKKYKYIKTLEM